MNSSAASFASSRRIGRRRLLAAAGSMSAAAALFAACGSSGSSKTPSNKSSLISQPVDETKAAKRGGALKLSLQVEPARWDPYVTGAWFANFGPLVFSRLTQIQAGVLTPADGSITGELADSWEWSPDKLTLTMKLKPAAGWAPIAPVNGRKVVAGDVLASWQRYIAMGASSADFANVKNPNAPITSITSPDPQTLVFKLARPRTTLIALLGAHTGGYFHILPSEVDSGYDARRAPIGSGPFYVSNQVPSASLTLKRNPNYWDTQRPYLDQIDYPILTEYAANLAQLITGGIHTFALKAEDVLATKKQTPQLALYPSELAADATAVIYGFQPTDANVFRDQRMRQAYSRALDRDLWIDVVYNATKFQQEGVPIQTAWSSIVPSSDFKGWWLDPQGKDFGPNAIYFKHDLGEVKKLMSAAGHPDGAELISNVTTNGFGGSYVDNIDILDGMAADAGFRVTKKIWDYTTEWQPRFIGSRGKWDGLGYRPIAAATTDSFEKMAAMLDSRGGIFFPGFDSGNATYDGDPKLEAWIDQGRAEADNDKRKAIGYDIQRYVAEKQYITRFPGGGSGYSLFWPTVRNVAVYLDDQRNNYYYWLDPNQPPSKS